MKEGKWRYLQGIKRYEIPFYYSGINAGFYQINKINQVKKKLSSINAGCCKIVNLIFHINSKKIDLYLLCYRLLIFL